MWFDLHTICSTDLCEISKTLIVFSYNVVSFLRRMTHFFHKFGLTKRNKNSKNQSVDALLKLKRNICILADENPVPLTNDKKTLFLKQKIHSNLEANCLRSAAENEDENLKLILKLMLLSECCHFFLDIFKGGFLLICIAFIDHQVSYAQPF